MTSDESPAEYRSIGSSENHYPLLYFMCDGFLVCAHTRLHGIDISDGVTPGRMIDSTAASGVVSGRGHSWQQLPVES